MKDDETGRFVKQPDGEKTHRMLEVEHLIDNTLEEDYRENYLSGNMGQKKLARRWGVTRHLIFGSVTGGNRRRGWVGMLGLSKKDGYSSKRFKPRKGCEP